MKVLAGLVTSSVLALGATAVIAPAANAYGPHTVSTTCSASKAAGSATTSTKFAYAYKAGTVSPKSTVFIKVTKANGAAVKDAWFYYTAPKTVSIGQLKAGSYKVTFSSRTGSASIYKNCTVSKSFTIS